MNEETENKKVSKVQRIKMQIMHSLSVLMLMGTVMVSNAAAINNTSFQGITDVIDAVIPIFGSLIDLVIAIVPLTIIVAIIAAIIILIKKVIGNIKI